MLSPRMWQLELCWVERSDGFVSYSSWLWLNELCLSRYALMLFLDSCGSLHTLHVETSVWQIPYSRRLFDLYPPLLLPHHSWKEPNSFPQQPPSCPLLPHLCCLSACLCSTNSIRVWLGIIVDCIISIVIPLKTSLFTKWLITMWLWLPTTSMYFIETSPSSMNSIPLLTGRLQTRHVISGSICVLRKYGIFSLLESTM